MQKIRQRTANAISQHKRKLAKVREQNAQIQRSIDARQYAPVGLQIQQDLRRARQARREDWELGSIAPRRDVGADTDTYGALDSRRLRGPEKPEKERIKFWNIVAGDRVVIIDGQDKGKIGLIGDVNKKTEEVIVEGLNMVEAKVPDHMKAGHEQRATLSVEAAVPLSSVRLVFPLQDKETGITRDVIVKKIANSNPYNERDDSIPTWRRYIPGLNVTIPWPEREPETHKTYDVDTLRIDVDMKTWYPTLKTPPMPRSVIDELRNKYSIFRDRHDPEYEARKEEEWQEATKSQRLSVLMRTPLQEANRRARRERKSKGRGKITPEMLSRIGEVMAAKRARVGSPQSGPA
ncbi:MAG: hypothetical protein M1835_000257 [Candelina submexicana]|nr:MAG: hypothetical protein M1835_000257 [Candelina submexicana]